MKKMSNSLLKAIFILVVYLLLIVVWGTSFVIWIVEESEYWALIWLISSVVILVLAFFVDAYSKDYKIKYYFLGKNFEGLIVSIDHWIAFILLSIIGINMIKECFKNDDENINDKFDKTKRSIFKKS